MLSWIRNLLGIRKDIVDTNKAKIDTLKSELEVDKLEDEASARNLITRATMDDVEKYNPKLQELERRIKEYKWGGLPPPHLIFLYAYYQNKKKFRREIIIFSLGVLLITFLLLYFVFKSR